MEPPLAHLSDALISNFLLGKLSDSEQKSAEEHLATCVECNQRAASLTPRDGLVDLLIGASTEPTIATFSSLSIDLSSHFRASQTTPKGKFSSSEVGASTLDFNFTFPAELLGHSRYRIIRLLGWGGMGSVWLAEHLVMRREVALKLIRPDLTAVAGAVERFQREVEATAKLNHPNIAAAYDAEQIGLVFFLVMEYVSGQSLSEIVKTGPQPVVESCRAIHDAALGLAHAHATGLVHRDVKPGNILRTPNGHVKVVDFGLVFAAGEDSSANTENLLMGTPDYVAPEQSINPGVADSRSDIYSLGCSLYHLLKGAAPFADVPIGQKISAHRFQAPLPLKNLPPGLWEVVKRMIEKDPGRRFTSASDVAEALKPYCDITDAVRDLNSRPSPDKGSNSGFFIRQIAVSAVILVMASLALTILNTSRPLRNGSNVYPTTGSEMGGSEQGESTTTNTVGIAASFELGAPTATFEEVGRFTMGLEQNAWRARVAFSVDGKIAYAASHAHPLAILSWNTNDQRLISKVPSTNGFAFSMSHDGRYFAGEKDFEIFVAATADGSIVQKFQGPTSPAWSTGFDPSGARIATAETDRKIHVWEIESGRLICKFQTDGEVRCVVFSPDCQFFAALGRDLIIWNIDNQQVLFQKDNVGAGACAITSDGSRLLMNSGSEIQVLKFPDGDVLQVLKFHQTGIESIRLTPDDQMVASVDNAGDICWWSLNDGKLLHRFFAHQGAVLDAAFHPSGKYLLSSGGPDGTVRLWRIPSLTSSKSIIDLTFPESTFAVAISPDAKRLAVAGGHNWSSHYGNFASGTDFSIRMIDIESGQVIHRLHGHNELVFHLKFDRNGRNLVSASKDSSICIWDTTTGELKSKLELQEPSEFALSPSSTEIISCGTKSGIRRWDIESGLVVEAMASNARLAHWCALDIRDDSQVAIGTRGKLIGFNPKDESSARKFNLPLDFIIVTAEFSQDGSRFLTSGRKLADAESNLVQLWDFNTGRLIRSWPGTAAAFVTKDGSQVLVGTIHSNAIERWEVAENRRLEVFTGHISTVMSISVSQDGSTAVSGGFDNTVRVWKIPETIPSSQVRGRD